MDIFFAVTRANCRQRSAAWRSSGCGNDYYLANIRFSSGKSNVLFIESKAIALSIYVKA
jgi:hypothetical protein